MTTRQEKVKSLLQKEIAGFIRNEDFEGIQGLLTITQVEVLEDLKHAKIFFSVIGQDEDEVLKILKRHTFEIQGMLNKKLEMKNIPRIVFMPDKSGQYAEYIGKLIRELHDKQGQ